jgi:hypothetical protein
MGALLSAPTIISSTTPTTLAAGTVIWTSGSTVNSSNGLMFDSTNFQLGVSNTYSNNSNYRRLSLTSTSSFAIVAADSLGTGGANYSLVLRTSGTGAIQTQVTDNTATGGNARGANAVDLQSVRSGPAQVASGANSFVVGARNTASNQYSSAIGWSNTASGDSASAIGWANIASGSYSSALGVSNTASGANSLAVGNTNTASGQSSVSLGAQNISNNICSVALGYGNTCSQFGSIALGRNIISSGNCSVGLGRYANTKNMTSLVAIGVSHLGEGFNPQTCICTLGIITTDATPTALRSDENPTGNAGNQFTILANSAVTFYGLISATTTNGGDCSSWEFKGQLQSGNSTNSGALVAAVTPVLIAQKAGASTWSVAITAASVNRLLITVTGEAGKTIRWVCSMFMTEVYF